MLVGTGVPLEDYLDKFLEQDSGHRKLRLDSFP